DLIVTGVQTCALPILLLSVRIILELQSRKSGNAVQRCGQLILLLLKVGVGNAIRLLPFLYGLQSASGVLGRITPLLSGPFGNGRSEERRVGKGCRSRW